MRYKIILSLCLMYLSMHTMLAQHNEYKASIHISSKGDSLPYRQLDPIIIEPSKKYPLVLFLHGAGERGNDNQAQLIHGAMMFTNPVNREKFPAFVLFPQCPKDNYWAMPKRPSSFAIDCPFPEDAPPSNSMVLVKELLDRTIQQYPIDKQRIYIIGLSMGGMGAFDMVCRNPDIFAAAIPICGGVNIQRLRYLKSNTKFRIFHGDADDIVPVKFSRKAYKILKEKGMQVEYFEFPGINHGSWVPTFNKEDFLTWLFQQRK